MSRPQDLNARNRDFIRYEQVHKRQDYRLAEAAGEERFDEDFVVRTCDMGAMRAGDAGAEEAFAEELGAALREIGFAILTGHGVPIELHEQAFAETERVFTGHGLEDKLRYRAERFGSVNQGYFPIEETSDIHPDLVEGWVFARRAFAVDHPEAEHPTGDFWPAVEHERFFRRLMLAQEQLILPLCRSMLRALGCDPHLYDKRLTDTNYALRLNYYPPLSDAQLASGAGRLLGHEDVTLFTMLPAPRSEGLQALDRSTMRWVRIQAPPGSIILNTGDYMQRLSNDIYPSTTHRVSKPRDPALAGASRVSFPMNVYLWEDEVMEVLPGTGAARYEPVRALRFHTRTTAKYYGDDYAVD